MLTAGTEVVLALREGRYLQGLAVSWDEQDLIVAAPVSAAPGGRVYTCRGADGQMANIVFVTGSRSAMVAEVAALAPESILGFATLLDPQSLTRLYHLEHSSSDGSPAAAASRPSALTALPILLAAAPDGGTASSWGLSPSEAALPEMRDMMRGMQSEMAQQRRTIGELQDRAGGRRPAAASARPATRGWTWDDLLGQEESGDGATVDEVSFGGSGPAGATHSARIAAPPEATGPSASPWYLRAAAAPTVGASAPAAARPAGLTDVMELLKELRLNRSGADGESGGEHPGFQSRGLDGVRRMRKEVYTNPEKMVAKYVEHMLTHLGITDTRQLWPESDPYEVAECGGLEQEMAQGHRYRKAVADVKAKVKQTPPQTQQPTPAVNAEEATGQPEKTKTGRGRGRGRNRDAAPEG